jgi:hypothetical protein
VNRNVFGIRFVCAVAAIVAISTPAAAQDRNTGQFSGLFNGSPKEQPHTLDLRGSFFGAFDDNLLGTAPSPTGQTGNLLDPRYLKSGFGSGLNAALNYGYRKTGTRSSIHLSGDADVREFSSQLTNDPLWIPSFSTGAGVSTNLTTRTTLDFGVGTAYAPFYQYLPFLKDTATETGPVGTDYGFISDSRWVTSLDATASITNRFSKRSSFSADVQWSQRRVVNEPESNLETRAAHAGFSHNLTRKLVGRIGYWAREARYQASPDPVRTHSIDFGLGYGDGLTLTFAKYYQLNFAIGTSIAKNGDPASVLKTGKSTQFMVDGSASLSRSLGRTWNASIGYVRGTSYIVGFLEPVFSDSASVSVGGQLGSRLQTSFGGGASRGQRLFSDDQSAITVYSASSRLTVAVSKNIGLYGQASYYRYAIPSDFMESGFVPKLGRRSVSVGVSSWLPIIKQRRGTS